jgi:hypothetical protein
MPFCLYSNLFRPQIKLFWKTEDPLPSKLAATWSGGAVEGLAKLAVPSRCCQNNA